MMCQAMRPPSAFGGAGPSLRPPQWATNPSVRRTPHFCHVMLRFQHSLDWEGQGEQYVSKGGLNQGGKGTGSLFSARGRGVWQGHTTLVFPPKPSSLSFLRFARDSTCA